MKKQFGHYEIVSELGRGGMGVVYKAHEQSLNRFVALKVLGQQVSNDEGLIARFKREAQSAAKLNHPHITQVYFFGQEEGQYYFVMEYVDGESLNALIRREKRLAPKKAAQLLLQAASGLAVAHDAGIVHRDIKPGNIMINRKGQVKLADFGIAHVQDADQKLTATGQFLGTPGYLSPEVCLGQPMDHRSDIFSLGIVYFEMLTGAVPFKADSPLAMLREVVESPIPDVRSLNADIDMDTHLMLDKMIAKKPENRYQNCEALIAALQAYLSGAPAPPLTTMAIDADAKSDTGPAQPDTQVLGSEAPTELIERKTEANQAYDAPTVASGSSVVTPPPPPPQQAAGPPPLPTPTEEPHPPAAVMSPRVQHKQPTKSKTPLFALVGLILLIGLAGLAYVLTRPEESSVGKDPLKDKTGETAKLDPSTRENYPKPAGDNHTDNLGTEEAAGDEPKEHTENLEAGAIVAKDNTLASANEPTDATVKQALNMANQEVAAVQSGHDNQPDANNETAVTTAGQDVPQLQSGQNTQADADTSSAVHTIETRDFDGPGKTSAKRTPETAAPAVVPAKPTMLVIVTGAPAISEPLAQTLAELLEGEGLSLIDPDLNPPPERLLGDLAGLGQFAAAAGADVLLLATVRDQGQREVGGGRHQATVYKVGITYKCYFPAGNRKLGSGAPDSFEYSSIKAEEKAELSANKVIDTLLDQIQANKSR